MQLTQKKLFVEPNWQINGGGGLGRKMFIFPACKLDKISLQCEKVSLMYFLNIFPPNHKISLQGASCFACFFQAWWGEVVAKCSSLFKTSLSTGGFVSIIIQLKKLLLEEFMFSPKPQMPLASQQRCYTLYYTFTKFRSMCTCVIVSQV